MPIKYIYTNKPIKHPHEPCGSTNYMQVQVFSQPGKASIVSGITIPCGPPHGRDRKI